MECKRITAVKNVKVFASPYAKVKFSPAFFKRRRQPRRAASVACRSGRNPLSALSFCQAFSLRLCRQRKSGFGLSAVFPLCFFFSKALPVNRKTCPRAGPFFMSTCCLKTYICKAVRRAAAPLPEYDSGCGGFRDMQTQKRSRRIRLTHAFRWQACPDT